MSCTPNGAGSTPRRAARLNAARAAGGRIVAVGTTSLRLLESAADEDGRVRPFEGDTAIFITPGYRFRAVDGLVTNFHLPRSTLFMLVSALMGLEAMQAAYAHAIARGLSLLFLWRCEPAAALTEARRLSRSRKARPRLRRDAHRIGARRTGQPVATVGSSAGWRAACE